MDTQLIPSKQLNNLSHFMQGQIFRDLINLGSEGLTTGYVVVQYYDDLRNPCYMGLEFLSYLEFQNYQQSGGTWPYELASEFLDEIVRLTGCK